MNGRTENTIVIQPPSGWQFIDLKELKQYSDLFFFLTWRSIKAMYAQSILGMSWAILQPLIQILLFTIIFGRVAKLSTEGIPYTLYVSVAVIPWTYVSQAINRSSSSLVAGQGMLGKVYFPRIIFPLSGVISKLIDFTISLTILVFILFYYQIRISWGIFLLPLFMLHMIATSASIGIWLSALAIRFRDVNHAMTFGIRMLMYTAPIVYSASTIPDKYRFFYSLNPIVGIIEGFRACLLGLPIPWMYIVPGMGITTIILVAGCFYFKRMEHTFVDVI
ncbi:MAG: ABC transporter permease [Desulfobacterales bacterium]